jgi:hypothetical protein
MPEAVSTVSEALQLCSLVHERAHDDQSVPSLEQSMHEHKRILAEMESMKSQPPLQPFSEPSIEAVKTAHSRIKDANAQLQELSMLLSTTWNAWTKQSFDVEAQVDGEELQRLMGKLELASKCMATLTKR